jgi:hypothetical protein
MKQAFAFLMGLLASAATACDLCAIYRAGDARGETALGPIFIVAEQYIPYRTSQVDGQVVYPRNPNYVDSSITHLVGGYSISSRFAVSLNVPLTHLSYRRTDLEYSLTAPPRLFTEQGTEFGLGDLSVIGRFNLLQKMSMSRGYVVNLLAGVKFPTGNSERLKIEVDQAEIYRELLPPNTPHDPLGHSISSVHQHDLALGSGSYDGIFGLTASGRWRRVFLNGQAQYYLRTRGEAGFQYGNEVIISGGPGYYVFLGESFTVSLQANAVFDWMARDRILGERTNQTGMTAWYLGPLVSLTWGERLNVNAGIDLPLSIENNGYQSVPDFRLYGGVSWRF